jgi:hypothetical protein
MDILKLQALCVLNLKRNDYFLRRVAAAAAATDIVESNVDLCRLENGSLWRSFAEQYPRHLPRQTGGGS